jgi:RNA-directed DNA polymerase
MSVEELPGFLKENWLSIKEGLLKGEYVPQAVRRVEIPKPERKQEKRKLGIPTVLDRFIQQAILQVLQSKWDERFSGSSYGFRPKRKAAEAVRQAQGYLKAGYLVVVDIDLEKFFDRVCHDRLMSRLAQEIQDKRVLKLIRRYLTAGILENGLVSTPTEGTPQGGPLSPFLSNVVLDELDKELEKRGHCFVRYADDSNIYVRSQRAGERVMESVSRFIEKRLKLRVNSNKSAVGEPKRRKFLGFSFTGGREPNRIKIAEPSLQRFRAQVRRMTLRNRGRGLEEVIEQLRKYLIGWRGYFQLAETPTIFRDLDSWIRRRLRSLLWKQWKVYANRKRELIQRGVPEDAAQSEAWSAKGPWRMSHAKAVQMALPNRYFDTMGLPMLATLNI